jgi:hypothetical protein
MRCKIVRFQRLMRRNMMRSTKSQKVSILYYSIDIYIYMRARVCALEKYREGYFFGLYTNF